MNAYVEGKVYLQNAMGRYILELEQLLDNITVADPSYDPEANRGKTIDPTLPIEEQSNQKIEFLKQISQAKELFEFFKNTNDYALLTPEDFENSLDKIETMLSDEVKALNEKIKELGTEPKNVEAVESLQEVKGEFKARLSEISKQLKFFKRHERRITQHFEAVIDRQATRLEAATGQETGKQKMSKISIVKTIKKSIKEACTYVNTGTKQLEYGIFKFDLKKLTFGINFKSPAIKTLKEGTVDQYKRYSGIKGFEKNLKNVDGGSSSSPGEGFGGSKVDFVASDAANQKPVIGSDKWFNTLGKKQQEALLNAFKRQKSNKTAATAEMVAPAEHPFIKDLKAALKSIGYDVKQFVIDDWKRMVDTLKRQGAYVKSVGAKVATKAQPYALKLYEFTSPMAKRASVFCVSVAPKLRHMPFKASAAYLVMRDTGQIINYTAKGQYGKAAATAAELAIISQMLNPRHIDKIAVATGSRAAAALSTVLKKAGPLVYVFTAYDIGANGDKYINALADGGVYVHDALSNSKVYTAVSDSVVGTVYKRGISEIAAFPFLVAQSVLQPPVKWVGQKLALWSQNIPLDMPDVYVPNKILQHWQDIYPLKKAFAEEQRNIIKAEMRKLSAVDPAIKRSKYKKMLNQMFRILAPQIPSGGSCQPFQINKDGELDNSKHLSCFDIPINRVEDILLVYKLGDDQYCLREPIAANHNNDDGDIQNNGIYFDKVSLTKQIKMNPFRLYLGVDTSGKDPMIGDYKKMIIDLQKDKQSVKDYLNGFDRLQNGLAVYNKSIYYGSTHVHSVLGKSERFEFSNPYFKKLYQFHNRFPEFKDEHQFTDILPHKSFAFIVKSVSTKNQMLDGDLRNTLILSELNDKYLLRNAQTGRMVDVFDGHAEIAEYSIKHPNKSIKIASHPNHYYEAQRKHKSLIVEKGLGITELGIVYQSELANRDALANTYYVEHYKEYTPEAWMTHKLPKWALARYKDSMQSEEHFCLTDIDGKVLIDETSQTEFVRKLEAYEGKTLLYKDAEGENGLGIWAPYVEISHKRRIIKAMRSQVSGFSEKK